MTIYQPQPISKDSAIRRIKDAGLTIAQAMSLSDHDLLRRPTIGRKTLRWIRTFAPIET
jgi:hypothetical protein